MTNPWLFLTVVIWVVCGAVSIALKSDDAIVAAVVSSILLGFLYLIMHHQ